MAKPSIFKAYDVRGTYPDQINEPLARAIGSAFATFSGAPCIVIARDMRPSGQGLCLAFAEGARSVGTAVIDLGLASTDFLYFGSGFLDMPGAMFTASHNPAQYNGIKMCLAAARPIGVETGLREIEELTHKFLESPPSAEMELLSVMDISDEWVQHVHSFTDISALRPLKVVADVANGMGGLIVPLVLDEIGLDLEVMYEELDGTFPNHPADPIQPENLRDLQARVLEVGADIGLAFDGDADRVFLIDEKAQPISGSTTTALVAAAMLQRNPGATVLHNLICSRAVPEVIEENGGTAVRTKVGHSFIKQIMAETGAVFGGEHSGHYYYRDNYRADSGIITALIVLGLMSSSDLPLSEFVKPYVRYSASGEINFEVKDPMAAVTAIAERETKNGATVDLLDGATITHDGWWYNVRPSNTEPLLRLNLEAADAESCAKRVSEIEKLISDVTGH